MKVKSSGNSKWRPMGNSRYHQMIKEKNRCWRSYFEEINNEKTENHFTVALMGFRTTGAPVSWVWADLKASYSHL
jgi:hypothetical protein